MTRPYWRDKDYKKHKVARQTDFYWWATEKPKKKRRKKRK